MKIQVDIPENLNKRLKIYKERHGLIRLQDALIRILSVFFKEKKNDEN